MNATLLRELLSAYGPCGAEDAVRQVCARELEPLVDDMWVDPAGNLVGVIRGGDLPPIRVMAHLDELSMIIKRVEPDGSLPLRPGQIDERGNCRQSGHAVRSRVCSCQTKRGVIRRVSALAAAQVGAFAQRGEPLRSEFNPRNGVAGGIERHVVVLIGGDGRR